MDINIYSISGLGTGTSELLWSGIVSVSLVELFEFLGFFMSHCHSVHGRGVVKTVRVDGTDVNKESNELFFFGARKWFYLSLVKLVL